MKKLFLATLFAMAFTAAAAQRSTPAGAATSSRRSTVSGVVADADTRQSLVGALVELAPSSDTTRKAFVVSGAGGVFSTGVGREPIRIRVSLLGYQPAGNVSATITEARHTLDTIYLRQGVQLEAVVKQAVAMRTSVKGDTLIYSADSYKVASDATVSGLLEKMPGIKVENGAVEAQGETVKKILIDNKEFFGEDVAAAISSLPAEAVKSVEVFDKLSDNAEFTGIDDGEGYKAINIVTRESMRQGVMGQVSALYGVEPPETDSERWNHYGLAGGNVSVFHGDAKITVGGTLNNLNERHFTSEDILGAGDDDGIAKVGRLQLNYIDELGKKNQWKINASYSYNHTDADALSTVEREYFASDDALYTDYYSSTRRNTVNNGHSFNGRIDWKPNQYQELRIRPVVRFQGNESWRTSSETYIPKQGDPISLDGWRNSDQSGYMAGVNVNYRIRLGKPGRTLSMFFNTDYDPDDREGETSSQRQDGTEIRQYTPSRNYDFGIGAGLTYTEPLSASSLVNFDYSIRRSYSDQDKKAYLWNGADYNMSTPDADLSGINNSAYTTHRVGPGYRFQKGKSTFSAGVFYQYSTLESNIKLPREYSLGQSFNNITYSALLNTQFPGGASIRMFLNSMTRNPDVFDMQDIADISNVQSITHGNRDLKPSYNNMLFTRFIVPNVEKGRTLAINFGGQYTTNAITQRTISESPGYQIPGTEGDVTLDAVGRYSQPVNMDGQWSVRGGVDYGFPVKWLRSNVNLDAGISYSESPSQLGKWTEGTPDNVTWTTNYSHVLSPNAQITIGSNISERIDFRVGYNAGYNRVRNTFSANTGSEYMRHRIRADFKLVLPAQFTLAGNARYDNYASLSGQSFRQEYLIVNAAVGKKIFRSRQGEISVFVNDMFNQNVSFRRNSYAQYIQNQTNSAIGRYVGVKFTWNIRKFGKNGSQNPDLYRTDDPSRHGFRGGGGPGGPPPGGGGGFGGGRPF